LRSLENNICKNENKHSTSRNFYCSVFSCKGVFTGIITLHTHEFSRGLFRSNPLNGREPGKELLAELEQFDLSGHGEKYPAQLSGGMKKRVGLSRALMLQPKIMLFDEPTTGLDPEISMEIYRLFFKTQKKFGYTSIIVSHDIPKVFNLADQVILLKDSKMITFDSPEKIQYSVNPEIQSFVQTTMGQVYISQDMEKLS